jgi:hypothetical protein
MTSSSRPEPPSELADKLIAAAHGEVPSDTAIERAMAAIDGEDQEAEADPDRSGAADIRAVPSTATEPHSSTTAAAVAAADDQRAGRARWLAIAAISLGAVGLFAVFKAADDRAPVSTRNPVVPTVVTVVKTVVPAVPGGSAVAAASPTASASASAAASSSATAKPAICASQPHDSRGNGGRMASEHRRFLPSADCHRRSRLPRPPV